MERLEPQTRQEEDQTITIRKDETHDDTGYYGTENKIKTGIHLQPYHDDTAIACHFLPTPSPSRYPLVPPGAHRPPPRNLESWTQHERHPGD